MVGLLTAVHVLIAIVLILIVLVQSAKGTDIGSAFGGMGSQATFGPRGTATFLSKATVGLAVVFMVTSVTLSILASRSTAGGESVLSGETTTAPATSAPSGTAPAAPPAGAPAAQADMQGLQGMRATVTVENPGEESGEGTPAATVEMGTDAPAASAAPPAAAPAAPSGQ
jgi:preprotein translocase subunit SecG